MVTACLNADERTILARLREYGPTRYRSLKDILGHDRVRVLNAIDSLVEDGLIGETLIGYDTHYRLVP